MIKRNAPRHALLGLILASTFIIQPAMADETAAQPLGSNLQTLKELDGKAPARRALNIQTWNTAEGAKVLFVESRELPMIDIA